MATLTLTPAEIAAASHARAERIRAERARASVSSARHTRLILLTTVLTVLVVQGLLGLATGNLGCREAVVPDPTKIPDQTQPISVAQQTVTTGAADVATRAGNIGGHASAAKANTPPASKPIIWPDLDAILVDVLGLQQDSVKLNAVTQDLAATNVQVGRLQDTVAADAATIKSQAGTIGDQKTTIADYQAHQSKIIDWGCGIAIGVGTIAIGFAVMAGLSGNVSGATYLGGGGASAIATGVTVITYHKQIAIVFGVVMLALFLAAIADLIYDWVKKSKENAAKTTANAALASANADLTKVGTELTQSVEIAKDQMTPAARVAYHGVGAVADSLLDDAQSAITKLFVKKAKASGAVRPAKQLPLVVAPVVTVPANPAA